MLYSEVKELVEILEADGEAVLARPYLAVSIQGPQGAAQLVCVGQSQSGGLRFSQQFSGCLCVGGGSFARTRVTFNMVEAGPITSHLLRDSQRGRKSVTCGQYYQSYFQTVSPLSGAWKMPKQAGYPSLPHIYAHGLTPHTCKRKSTGPESSGGFQFQSAKGLVNWETLSGPQ